MTNGQLPTRLPDPGWYIDPSSGRRRWWNGIAWSSHTDAEAMRIAGTGAAPIQPVLSSSTSIQPWPVWLLVVLPVLTALPLLTVDFDLYLREVLSAALRHQATPVPLPRGIIVAQTANLLAYPLSVVLALLDHRALRRLGLTRPFHWAWCLLAGIVYIIGRGVVLKRRVGRGTSATWAYMLVYLGVGVVEGVIIGSTVFSVLSGPIAGS